MPDITLTKDIEGRLCGISEKDNAGYERFLAHAINMPADESIKFSWRKPRSPKFHKRHFVMLLTVFKAQDNFTDDNHFRKWAEVGGGYADLLPGKDGQLVAVPKSINYESLDQVEFEEVHRNVLDFLRSEWALKTLWPHLGWERAYAMLDSLLMEFER